MSDIEVNKLDMKSEDIVSLNIKNIGKLFPNVIVESENGKSIDFDVLKQELSKEIVNGNKERYQLTWPGKKEAIITANRTTTNTLRPLKESSLNFKNAKNIFIEGDNLEVLKILQESYLNKIKCIYIDPPYNTGNDFIYNDNFSTDETTELINSGQLDENGHRLVSNNASNGRFHSDWLTMMYPRLKLARNLLKNDGILFISIDDNELVNCVKLCEEIFGEANLINIISLKTNETKGLKNSGVEKKFPKNKEYLIIVCKDRNQYKFNIRKVEKEDEELRSYMRYYHKYIPNIEDDVSKWHIEDFKKLIEGKKEKDIFEIKKKYANKLIYLVKPDNEIKLDIKENEFKKVINNKGNKVVYYKNKGKIYNVLFLSDNKEKNLGDLWTDISTININKETYEMPTYYNGQKPIKLIERVIDYVTSPNDNEIILDFFAGSATTADAVIRLNNKDKGNRKFIVVQIGEDLEENLKKVSNADTKKKINILIKFFKSINLSPNLKEYGKERLRRAFKLAEREGFRIYKVSSSNMKDVYYTPKELKQKQLNMFETNIKEDRTAEDLLTQVILNLGLTLDLKIEERKILKNNVYFVQENSLVACFDDKIYINILDEICNVKPNKIVFKESSFNNDSDKINIYEKIKKLSPETEINII